MTKTITFEPAFDKRSTNPSKNYGIHGVSIRFVYGDEKGYVQFLLYTGWHLPHVTKELSSKLYMPIQGDYHWMERPTPVDLGYHSPTPQYENQPKMDKCDLLPNGCYCDGSALNAQRVYNTLLEKGSDGVWLELENYYNELFQA